MIAAEFRQAALGQPEAVEGEHGGHPDFRVRGKIFAGLTKDGSSASLKLDPEQQEILMAALPRIFSPAAGSWGRRGWTRVALEAAHPDDIMP
ncbi:MAG TPA: MmcQ/YjbR family DNA-binding protein, partial [Paracoccaceae bacterium]|nr:MmcQ/YjbR family DNA-binding protein [Paracoccaceae bacterium]